MRLLFDHNLSPRLVDHLRDLHPEATHVALVGLERASDDVVWSFARANDLTIVTKDSDFNAVSVLRGFPPKVIWIRLGNCTTADVEQALRRHHEALLDFASDPTAGILEIF